MADTKTPDLTTATLTGTDELPVWSGAATKKTTAQTIADLKTWGNLAGKPATFPPDAHSVTGAGHSFPGGTTTFLRADGTFAAPPGGSSPMPWDVVFIADLSAVWTNMPAALTEWQNSVRARVQADLTNMTQVRLQSAQSVTGTSASKLRAQYSTDGGTNWSYLDGATGPEVSANGTGLKVGGWVNLAAGAKADVMLRLVGLDGDAVADPAFGNIRLQFK